MTPSKKDNIRRDDTQDLSRLCHLATSLLKNGGALQSGNVAAPVTDEVLRASLEMHTENQEAYLAAEEGRTPSPLVPSQVAGDIIATARNALKRFENGASPSTLSEHERDALQAIIEVTGRPALRYLNGHVQPPPSSAAENEHWVTFITTSRKEIEAVSRSVGRVVIEHPGVAPDVIGTAWRLGADLLVINRHVARRLVVPGESDPSQWQFDASRVSAVDFAATDRESAPARFEIVALEYCAPEKYVDLAVLRLHPRGGAAPPALTLDTDPEALGMVVEADGGSTFSGAEIYVVGHPLEEKNSQQIKRVFGSADGRKRCSPGYVTLVQSRYALLEHDCSTLAGNSGSCVVTRAHHRVVGLHFGGRGVDEASGVGDTNLAVALTRLGKHPAGQILLTGRIKGSP